MKNNNIFASFKYAFSGIYQAVKSERNMKIHVCCSVLVLIFGLIFKISLAEWLICILWIGGVIAAEMFNTAIEAAVDLASPQYNVLARKAKDVSAGAVLVLAVFAAISAAVIFLPKILTAFGIFTNV